MVTPVCESPIMDERKDGLLYRGNISNLLKLFSVEHSCTVTCFIHSLRGTVESQADARPSYV